MNVVIKVAKELPSSKLSNLIVEARRDNFIQLKPSEGIITVAERVYHKFKDEVEYGVTFELTISFYALYGHPYCKVQIIRTHAYPPADYLHESVVFTEDMRLSKKFFSSKSANNLIKYCLRQAFEYDAFRTKIALNGVYGARAPHVSMPLLEKRSDSFYDKGTALLTDILRQFSDD